MPAHRRPSSKPMSGVNYLGRFADERRAVTEGNRVTRVSLYKVFLFVHVVRAIKASTPVADP